MDECQLLADTGRSTFEQGAGIECVDVRYGAGGFFGLRRRSSDYSNGHIRRAGDNKDPMDCRTVDSNDRFKWDPALRPLLLWSSSFFRNGIHCLVALFGRRISGRGRPWPKHEISLFPTEEVRRPNVRSWPKAELD